MTNVSEKLLDAAEGRIRKAGFHAMSFRDLASDLGIKSASVHYHFPKKEDLGVAVIDRYASRFFAAVEARVTAGEGKVHAFVETYREALTSTDTACLCGVMGAEALGLPEPIRARLTQFMKDNVVWLSGALAEAGIPEPDTRASLAVAALQGAMMLSINLGDRQVFDNVARNVAAIA